MKVRPFTIAVENSVLDDLRQRLADTRWPDEIPNTGWTTAATCPISRSWSITGGRTSIGVPRKPN